ncbi:auxin-binding protein ABP19b-like [Vicia villosa]|uniref:auxin-binding protein ABP19b-like n=1 Tax=Vicia villosa TaxID=3911 RepID=UPI00273A8670|nr:auxin-binding protein ABP19b-like [Vicia villosa]
MQDFLELNLPRHHFIPQLSYTKIHQHPLKMLQVIEDSWESSFTYPIQDLILHLSRNNSANSSLHLPLIIMNCMQSHKASKCSHGSDLSRPKTPSGYQSKSEKDVTVNDVVFSGFVPENPTENFNTGITFVNVDKLPGLNGLGISTVREDLDANGTVPLHSHLDAIELIIIVEGQVNIGFITPTNVF